MEVSEAQRLSGGTQEEERAGRRAGGARGEQEEDGGSWIPGPPRADRSKNESPTSAMAAAWRRFILLSLEARIVG